ncbi:MAG: Bug family tripartite tricarboxylate transporter substrate binding protein [Usitatibacter sp.]
MTFARPIFLAASLLSLLLPAFAQYPDRASAQAWPSKPVKIIVPYPPGGTSDILARSVGQKLTETLGQVVVVENKPGATGNIGADFVAKSPPDGYTLLLADIGSLAISPSVSASLPFDPVKDFAPVVMVAYSPHLLAAHPSVPANTVSELIALLKAKPDSLNFAVSGIGGANHLAGIDFAARTGVKWTYVPYKGGSQAITDVMAGHAQVLFNGMLATYPAVKDGKLKAIAISSAKRFAAAPDIPTVAESGVPGFETGSWQGIVAAAGTPPEVVKKIHASVTAILATPEMKEKLIASGAEVRPQSPEQFGAFIRDEKARWAKVVKESGAKFD